MTAAPPSCSASPPCSPTARTGPYGSVLRSEGGGECCPPHRFARSIRQRDTEIGHTKHRGGGECCPPHRFARSIRQPDTDIGHTEHRGGDLPAAPSRGGQGVHLSASDVSDLRVPWRARRDLPYENPGRLRSMPKKERAKRCGPLVRRGRRGFVATRCGALVRRGRRGFVAT